MQECERQAVSIAKHLRFNTLRTLLKFDESKSEDYEEVIQYGTFTQQQPV